MISTNTPRDDKPVETLRKALRERKWLVPPSLPQEFVLHFAQFDFEKSLIYWAKMKKVLPLRERRGSLKDVEAIITILPPGTDYITPKPL